MISFNSSSEGYLNFLVERSLHLASGKRGRKRFYIGFSMFYIIVWIAVFYYILMNGFLPNPFFYMFIVLYIVLMAYMKYVDIYSISISRKGIKDLIRHGNELNNDYSIEIENGRVLLKCEGNLETHSIDECVGYSENNEYITLFFNENSGISIPLNLEKNIVKKNFGKI